MKIIDLIEKLLALEDVVTYFFKNPKDYIGFKKQLLARYKEGEFAEDTDNFATHYLYGKYKIVFNKFKNKMEDTGNEIETYCFTISFRK
ncbi:MAG: hypothetical protein HWD58_20220 [Bacteroidota bacterium]|nr:MAG: hypothetical protein HWD58_20220 [Bacteroidota bacterium]